MCGCCGYQTKCKAGQLAHCLRRDDSSRSPQLVETRDHGNDRLVSLRNAYERVPSVSHLEYVVFVAVPGELPPGIRRKCTSEFDDLTGQAMPR